jgi:hypothetical protein
MVGSFCTVESASKRGSFTSGCITNNLVGSKKFKKTNYKQKVSNTTTKKNKKDIVNGIIAPESSPMWYQRGFLVK